jgi:hypothetical protein
MQAQGIMQVGLRATDPVASVAFYRDDDGTFGPAGTEDWMAFCKDPSGNTIGLVERRAAARR